MYCLCCFVLKDEKEEEVEVRGIKRRKWRRCFTVRKGRRRRTGESSEGGWKGKRDRERFG